MPGYRKARLCIKNCTYALTINARMHIFGPMDATEATSNTGQEGQLLLNNSDSFLGNTEADDTK